MKPLPNGTRVKFQGSSETNLFVQQKLTGVITETANDGPNYLYWVKVDGGKEGWYESVILRFQSELEVTDGTWN